MADNQETVADVLKDMRVELANYRLRDFADRIEAAWGRERGNAAAMREALEAWLQAYDEFVCKPRIGTWTQNPCGTLVIPPISAAKLVDKTNAALSAPPRNCDVGTAKEQKIRFVSWCESHDRECENCPLRAFRDSGDCGFEWIQMLYEAKERGENDGSK